MKLWRRPGTFIAFIDSPTDETILRIDTNAEGVTSFTFRLYDRFGVLAEDSGGPREYPLGTEICTDEGEVLLRVPIELNDDIHYRLYGSTGNLITCSDGNRTQILLGLRMEGNKHLSGRPPARPGSGPPPTLDNAV